MEILLTVVYVPGYMHQLYVYQTDVTDTLIHNILHINRKQQTLTAKVHHGKIYMYLHHLLHDESLLRK